MATELGFRSRFTIKDGAQEEKASYIILIFTSRLVDCLIQIYTQITTTLIFI